LQRKHKINDEILANELRVVDASGGQLGILSRRDALRMAEEQEIDLVEIAPQAKPPVCKLIDYGKFLYEIQKREKDVKKAQTHTTLKEIRFKAGTDVHDFEFKTRHAREFLIDGHKVKATVFFRGREVTRQELGSVKLQKFIDMLADVSKVDQPMRSEGRTLTVTLAPEVKKVKAEKPPKTEQAKDATASTDAAPAAPATES
jgi:translation initiation factor IF-3